MLLTFYYGATAIYLGRSVKLYSPLKLLKSFDLNIECAASYKSVRDLLWHFRQQLKMSQIYWYNWYKLFKQYAKAKITKPHTAQHSMIGQKIVLLHKHEHMPIASCCMTSTALCAAFSVNQLIRGGDGGSLTFFKMVG